MDGSVGRRAKRLEQQQDPVFLNHLAHLFDGLWRAVAVVAADEVDLASFDTALFVNHCEVGGLRLANDSVRRGRTAVGHRVADLYLGVARARSVLASGPSQSTDEYETDRRQAHGDYPSHDILPYTSSMLRSRDVRSPMRIQIAECPLYLQKQTSPSTPACDLRETRRLSWSSSGARCSACSPDCV